MTEQEVGFIVKVKRKTSSKDFYFEDSSEQIFRFSNRLSLGNHDRFSTTIFFSLAKFPVMHANKSYAVLFGCSLFPE